MSLLSLRFIPLLFLQVTAAVLVPGRMVGPLFTSLVTGLLKKSRHLCSSSNLGQNAAQDTVRGPAGQLHQIPIATKKQGCVLVLFRIQVVHSCPSSPDTIFLLETVPAGCLSMAEGMAPCALLLGGCPRASFQALVAHQALPHSQSQIEEQPKSNYILEVA